MNYDGNQITRKSIIGFLINFDCNPITWLLKLTKLYCFINCEKKVNIM